MNPTDTRIIRALTLQPMNVAQLATCLALNRETVRKRVRSLRYGRRLHGVAVLAGNGRPWMRYEVRS